MARDNQFSKVNQPPRGLQSFLGNVNQGVNPHELHHVISPGVAQTPFLGVDKTTVKFATANTSGTIGQGVNLVVPNGEVWMIINASAQYFVPLNESRTISLRIVDPSLGNACIVDQQRLTNASNVAEVCARRWFGGQFILPSGWGFRSQVDESSIATISSMTVFAIYYRLQA